MTWSYDNTLATEKDQVRFLIQDNVPGRALVQDEEIAWLLQTEANVYMAAAMALDTASMAANQGRSMRRAGDVAVQWFTPQQQTFLSRWLLARGSAHQVPTAGGIYRSDKEMLPANDDWLQLPVILGSTDNPYARSTKPLIDPVNPIVPGTF